MNKGEVDLYETTEELCESGWLGRAVGSYSKWIGRKKVSLAGYASPIFANRSTIGWTSIHYVVGAEHPARCDLSDFLKSIDRRVV